MLLVMITRSSSWRAPWLQLCGDDIHVGLNSLEYLGSLNAVIVHGAAMAKVCEEKQADGHWGQLADAVARALIRTWPRLVDDIVQQHGCQFLQRAFWMKQRQSSLIKFYFSWSMGKSLSACFEF